jgi:putative Mg2+ transporter-C (MgtC) family protein
LNTAATLWLAAALGVTAGSGAYPAAILGTAVVLVVLVVMRVATPLLLRLGSPVTVLEIDYERGHGTIGPLLRSLASANGKVERIEVDDDDGGMRHVTVRLRAPRDNEVSTVVSDVQQRPEVRAIRLLPRTATAD